jgi:hypothetical protein
LTGAAVVLTAAVAMSLGDAAGRPPAGDRYTPVVQSVPSKPRWFRGDDGLIHLVYELKMTNAFPNPVRVRAVGVLRGGHRHRPVRRLRGERLRSSMSLLATPSKPTRTIPPSSIGVVWFDVRFARRSAIPRSISHRVAVHVMGDVPVPSRISSRGGHAVVDRRPPVVIGPPLRGRRWLAVGSCCDGPHRRSFQPVNGRLRLGQRFAIDWNGLNARRHIVVGNPDRNRSWVFYGKPVIAVADGLVVKAVDRFPNQVPNHQKPVTLRQADGNYVILSIGHGRFAFYAHLAPHSIRVHARERVHRGEVIGKLGNSGSSTGPHLHFQVMNRPSALDSNGLPFVYDRFRVRGKIPPLDDIKDVTKPIPIDHRTAGPRRDEYPLGLDVVDFLK